MIDDCWDIVQGNETIAQCKRALVRNAAFHVNKTNYQRRCNAYITGHLIRYDNKKRGLHEAKLWNRAHYNPYGCKPFVDSDTKETLLVAELVFVTVDQGVFYV
jgi:hypothetical protein